MLDNQIGLIGTTISCQFNWELFNMFNVKEKKKIKLRMIVTDPYERV